MSFTEMGCKVTKSPHDQQKESTISTTTEAIKDNSPNFSGEEMKSRDVKNNHSSRQISTAPCKTLDQDFFFGQEYEVPLFDRIIGSPVYDLRYDIINEKVYLGASVVGKIVAFTQDEPKKTLTHFCIASNKKWPTTIPHSTLKVVYSPNKILLKIV